jgi:UDP-3-O-[3-hydroxymyristoyl] N-acetylglucosamine deacetylase/3-hydroxyacyl-[acyl-carrier-protein] dehydratase
MTQNQRTIRDEVRFSGKALQTGRSVEMVCRPGLPDSGVIFKRTDIPDSPVVRLKDVALSDEHKRRTTIGTGPVAIQTVEHFLAALWGLSIDNLQVELNGPELPATDGSARGFIEKLKKTGVTEQSAPRCTIKIQEAIRVEDGDQSLEISPDEKFSVSYLIDYKVGCISREVFDIELDQETFQKEIAPARTFCMKKEALFLFLAGLGRGANFKNTLVLGNKGPLGTKFRFPNEPVRHKVLDLVGDLYMLGVPVIGRVVAERSGHKLNGRLVRKIYEKYIESS